MQLAAGALMAVGPTSHLLAQLTLTGTSYGQDFNSIGTGLPTGWTARTTATPSFLGTSASFATAATGWSSQTGQFANYASATGHAGTEATAAQALFTDRAFGIRQTNAFANPGAAFTLQIGDTAGRTNFSLSFDAMMLSAQTKSTTWTIQYGIGANPTTFTDLGTYGDPGSFGVTNFSFDSTQLAGIENQSSNVWFRVVALSLATGVGNADTFGIDNFALSWSGSGVAPPVAQYWDLNGSASGIGGAGPATWNNSSSNWTPLADGTGAPTTFNSGSIAVFGGTSSAINVDGAGVTANAGLQFISNGYTINSGGGSVTLGTNPTITVTNSTDTATINAGIAGTSGLTKSGAGTLVLGGTSNYTGGTTINAGTLKIFSDLALGDASGALGLNGGTLVLGASISTARALPITSASTIDTNGFDLTVGGPLTAGGLTKLGNGKLTLQAASAGGAGPTNILGGTVRIENATAIGTGAVSVTNGSLELAGVTLTSPNTFPLTMNNGATLLATGSTFFSSSGSPAIANNATVTLTAPTVNDTLQINSGVTGGTLSSVVNVTGAGTVFLSTGLGLTNGSAYRGAWNVAMGPTGVLRLGNSNSFGNFSTTFASAAVVSGTVLVGSFNTSMTSPGPVAVQISTPTVFSGGTIGVIGTGAGSSGFTGALAFSPAATVTVDTNDFADHITGQVIQFGTDALRVGSLTWGASATVNVVGSGTLNFLRNTDNGGTVSVGLGAQMNIGALATVNLGGTLDALGNTTSGNYVSVGNSGTFNVITGAKNVGNLTGSGTTTIADGTSLAANRLTQSNLILSGSGSASVRVGATNNAPAKLSVVGSLSLSNGSLDLNNSDMVLTSTPLDSVRSAINAAATGGTFTGTTGITSSVAKSIDADPTPLKKTGLGYAVASSVNLTSVDGTPVNPTDVIVKYTLIGDSNLDGVVNALDFNAIATNFGTSGSWWQGDSTYDGTVDINDFVAMAQNFGAALPAPPSSSLPALGALVPEPTMLGLLGCAGLLMSRRRQRA